MTKKIGRSSAAIGVTNVRLLGQPALRQRGPEHEGAEDALDLQRRRRAGAEEDPTEDEEIPVGRSAWFSNRFSHHRTGPMMRPTRTATRTSCSRLCPMLADTSMARMTMSIVQHSRSDWAGTGEGEHADRLVAKVAVRQDPPEDREAVTDKEIPTNRANGSRRTPCVVV